MTTTTNQSLKYFVTTLKLKFLLLMCLGTPMHHLHPISLVTTHLQSVQQLQKCGTMSSAIKPGHPLNPKEKYTHICTVKIKPDADGNSQCCNHLLTLHKTKPKSASSVATWLSTKGGEHLTHAHPVDSEAGATGAKRSADKRSAVMMEALDYGMPDSEGKNIDPMSKMRLTKREISLTAQAQWYLYSSMRVSKCEFENVFLKAMLKAVGGGESTAILTIDNLKNYVKAEWGVFKLFLKFIMKTKAEEALGNTFAQAIHDGGTLTNKKKFQALAIQFVAPEWKKNMVVTLGLVPCNKSRDEDVARLWKDIMVERCGYEYNAVVARMRSDRAAKGVSSALDMEEQEVCEMHDTDKLGKAAIGALVRTRMRVPVNPFDEGVALISRAHKMGTYFGYSNRQSELSEVGKALGGCADIKIKVNYNTTRIASVHGLLHSELRLNRALKAFDLKFSPRLEVQGFGLADLGRV